MKKIGSDTPASAMPMAPRSNTVPRRRAEITPMLTPATSQMSAAPTTSEMVTGARSSSSGHTGCFVMKEYPRQGAGQCSTPAP